MNTTSIVLATAITLMAPILWASLGELVTETSGIMNVGIEGVMVLAAFTTAVIYQRTGNWPAALGAAAAVGLACAVVLGLLYVRCGAEQIVTGIVFSSTAIALAAILSERWPGAARVSSLRPVSIPVLSSIPHVGAILFQHNILVFTSILAVPCVYYLMRHTWFGLHARAAGERPLVNEVAGVSVRALRYVSLTLGCLVTAIGGATLVLSTTSTFQPGITDGRGFIALAVVVLARWNPYRALLGALLFGVAEALRFQFGDMPLLSHLPVQIILMAPYAAATIAVLLTRGSRYPSAVGISYRPRAETGK